MTVFVVTLIVVVVGTIVGALAWWRLADWWADHERRQRDAPRAPTTTSPAPTRPADHPPAAADRPPPPPS